MKNICKNLGRKQNKTKSFATNPLVQDALKLYEHQKDVEKFSKFITDSEITEEFLVNTQVELALKDIFNPFIENNYKDLAQNKQLLEDLNIKD